MNKDEKNKKTTRRSYKLKLPFRFGWCQGVRYCHIFINRYKHQCIDWCWNWNSLKIRYEFTKYCTKYPCYTWIKQQTYLTQQLILKIKNLIFLSPKGRKKSSNHSCFITQSNRCKCTLQTIINRRYQMSKNGMKKDGNFKHSIWDCLRFHLMSFNFNIPVYCLQLEEDLTRFNFDGCIASM